MSDLDLGFVKSEIRKTPLKISWCPEYHVPDKIKPKKIEIIQEPDYPISELRRFDTL